MARYGGRVSLDLGTGDGRLPYAWARNTPERLFVGIDASAAGLRVVSGRASRERLANLVCVRAAVEALPAPLAGVADRMTVVLPWGSLLAAVARPAAGLLSHIRALCQPQASLTVVFGVDPDRDRSEMQRLGLPPELFDDPAACLHAGYVDAGFALQKARPLRADELTAWPSSWARRLSQRSSRRIWQIEATAISLE